MWGRIGGDAPGIAGFDDGMRQELARLFLGTGPNGTVQASLSAAVGGLGSRRVGDVANAANLVVVEAVGPVVRRMPRSRPGLAWRRVLEAAQVHKVADGSIFRRAG